MHTKFAIRTFAAANSSSGFISLFEPISASSHTFIIKGGPGCGKSTLMKHVASAALKEGRSVEYIYCSSDSDSLDGVYLKDENRFICDGTSPHTVEPRFPGAKDTLIPVGECWDTSRLQQYKDEIISLSGRSAAQYKTAYAFLHLAGEGRVACQQLARPFWIKDRLDRYVEGFIKRNIPDKPTPAPRLHRRFLSAYSHKGFITCKDTVYTLADRVVSFYDTYGLAPYLMQKLCDDALQKGYEVYVFYDPLLPENIAHIVIPELSFGAVTASRSLPFEAQNAASVNLSRYVKPDVFSVRQKHTFCRKLSEDCIKAALEYIARAKRIHDDLEEYYISAMDFDRLHQIEDRVIKEFL